MMTKALGVLLHYVDASPYNPDLRGVTDVDIDETSATRGPRLHLALRRPQPDHRTPGSWFPPKKILPPSTTLQQTSVLTAIRSNRRCHLQYGNMSQAFIKAVGERSAGSRFPATPYTVQLLTNALDQVCRTKTKSAPALLRSTRHLWMKRLGPSKRLKEQLY